MARGLLGSIELPPGLVIVESLIRPGMGKIVKVVSFSEESDYYHCLHMSFSMESFVI